MQASQPKKRGRPRIKKTDSSGTKAYKLDLEIKRLEAEIRSNANKYEECRNYLKMGITSIDAVDTTKTMETYMAKLKLLKQEREEVKTMEEPQAKRARAAAVRSNQDNCPGKCMNMRADPEGCFNTCEDCGTIYDDMSFCSETSYMAKYGEPSNTRRRAGGYKPPTHFSEIVGRFQGSRNNSTAPEDVVERIKKYCARYKSTEVNPSVVRFFLKRMQQEENNRFKNSKDPNNRLRRYTDYYKHAPEIASTLSGVPPPYMTPMQEEKILSIFPLVVAGYVNTPRYKQRLANRAGRKKPHPNNPNYHYVFYKIAQMLGYDEFLPYIPLPKSTDNIDENDELNWKYICEQYGWQYIPTR